MSKPYVSIRCTIAELAPGGDGVAHVEHAGARRSVFVRAAAVGDEVNVRVDFSRSPARGTIVELLAFGPSRVEPSCLHYDACGGCDLMHLRADAQADVHASWVRDGLSRLFGEATVGVHAAVEPWGYRSRARLHAVSKGGRVHCGFFREKSHEPLAALECPILRPEIESARKRIPELLAGATGAGEIEVAGGALLSPRPVVLVTRWRGDLPPSYFSKLERALGDGWLGGARTWIEGATSPMDVGDATAWAVGADTLPLKLGIGSFSQASDAMNRALAERVSQHASFALPTGPAKPSIAELYAGSGNFSVLLARLGANLVSIEASADASARARENLAARGLHARVVCADAGAHAWPGKPNVLVLDPPRTGARDVMTRIVSCKIPRVVYVSCDPATLLRDLAILANGGYRLALAETFEMFPQTRHVETLVVLDSSRVRVAGPPPATLGPSSGTSSSNRS